MIGLVAPASTPVSAERIQKGAEYLERLGYRTILGSHITDQVGYLAGKDSDRADDFNRMVRNKLVKAIFCIRGGYGTPRMLSMIDYAAVKRTPKIIVGYSDITALQLAIFRKTGLITYSGPMTGVEMFNAIDPFTEEHFWRLLTSKTKVGALAVPGDQPLVVHRAGRASGLLLGGNMSLVACIIGTRYCPNLIRSVLVLEDVEEEPHRVDRMWTQIVNAGIASKLSALVLGQFTDCAPKEPDKPHLTIDQVLKEISGSVRCPSISNLAYGHVPKKITLPLGAKARVVGGRGTIEILEGVVR
jgi:muramoyltetrapeptide carboxypeptidase